jgi:hypothetical protein
MTPFVSIKKGMHVIVNNKSHIELSTVTKADIGKIFSIVRYDICGRRHNKYISTLHLSDKSGRQIRACIDELSLCSPNFEPEGNFIVCISCGAHIAESDLVNIKQLGNIKSCPACGVLEPDKS